MQQSETSHARQLFARTALLCAALGALGTTGLAYGRTTVDRAGVATTAGLPAAVPIATNPANWPDIHSQSQPLQFVTSSFHLDLDVDFAARVLRGHATLDVRRVNPRASELVLDTRDLQIDSVQAAPAGSDQFKPVRFRLDPPAGELGSALRIEVQEGLARVRIAYATSPQASGLQWLAAAQTADKHAPFMFSQAQAIHARSMAPLQDTPWIRSTYTATLRVPAGLVAVMAAEADPANLAGGTVFRFHMPQSIPPYLLALAVGKLEFRAIGPRTGVWAEPSLVAAAAAEFEDAERMMLTAEKLYGPYRWGRYDILMLPPSFPFGGMENPRLTFMTPTVIAGDKSLVGVLPHELAHSWSGNLVTNATLRDGWLNEGFTTYLERRIMESVYGEERARLEWGIGEEDLRRAMAELGPDEAWRSGLAPDLAGRPADEGSDVAYEKGALFLYQLERRFGRAQLDAFLQGWFERHAFTSVTTPQFVGELQQHLFAKYPGRVDDQFLSRWIDGVGIPADAEFVHSAVLDRVDSVRMRWEQGTLATQDLPGDGWTTQEWLHFVTRMSRPQSIARLQELDQRFHLTASRNAEIAHAWFRLAIASDYPGLEPTLERYLVGIGRLKLIEPLYKDLLASPAHAAFVRQVYAEARPGYHAIAQLTLDKLMQEQRT
jgi:leukotriene-A4 hydrolase